MIKFLTSALSVFLLLSLVGCGGSNSGTPDTLELSSVNGKIYTLEIDRISKHPDVEYPRDVLDESDYQPADEVALYHVSFSEDGEVVAIDTYTVSGQEVANEDDIRSYDLDEGVAAGGRFVVRSVDDGVEAELTIYGSTISIIKSERGYLYQNDDTPAELTSLNGNLFALEIDRIAETPSVDYPYDDLDDSDYETADKLVQYNVRFSEDGKTVTIGSDPINGQEISNEDDIRSFELDEGLMAGGRFVLWIEQNEFEGELTTYGSGVPIIKSERGYLDETN